MTKMENLKIFTNSELGTVRTIENNGNIEFCGSDVAKALGYSNPSKALNDHCRYVTKRYIPHPQSKNKTIEMTFIPDGDVYRLITHSKLPSAKKFESWVYDEILPTMRKTGGYVSDDEAFINTYLPFMDESTKDMFRNSLATLRKQNEIIEKQKRELEYKEDVIIGLVDDITVADKRQILNRVVRYNNAKYQERWSILYREFENKYHIDLSRRLDSYNKTHKPKCKSKIDYIDKVMNKIPELYELASKLFENDVKALVDEMYEANKKER